MPLSVSCWNATSVLPVLFVAATIGHLFFLEHKESFLFERAISGSPDGVTYHSCLPHLSQQLLLCHLSIISMHLGVDRSTHVCRLPACPCLCMISAEGSTPVLVGTVWFWQGDTHAPPFSCTLGELSLFLVQSCSSHKCLLGQSSPSCEGHKRGLIGARCPGSCPDALKGHLWKCSQHSGVMGRD